MVGYAEVLSDLSTIYQLRFACRIKKINPQTPDPSTNGLNERKFVGVNKFFDHVKIEDYRPMIDEAIKWFQNK